MVLNYSDCIVFIAIFDSSVSAHVKGHLISEGFPEQRVLTLSKFDNFSNLVFSRIELPVTQRCSLRCRDCANLMQYYQNPKDTPYLQVIRDIDLMMKFIDYVIQLHILGGEPFIVNSDLPKYIAHLAVNYKHKFSEIRITTNGTILPTCDVLEQISAHKEHVRVYISDYGELSNNIGGLIGKLSHFNIPYIVWKHDWTHMHKLVDGEQNDYDYAIRVYQNCARFCTNMYNGKLYHCTFLAHAEELGAIPYAKENSVDLNDPHTTKSDVKKYRSNENIPPGCAFCGGDGRSGERFPSAVQVEASLKYKKYIKTLEE